MIAISYNWASVSNYLERILRLNKKDLRLRNMYWDTCQTVYETGSWMKGIVEKLDVFSTFDTPSERGYDQEGLKGQKGPHSEVIPL